ncbi:glycosyltransferase [Streptomyces sp. NPDC049954]|uniref:glycosyltransferase n=1 Tax=Streptomyces sp. NPDC049954 TaxID=3155779 RepID=UPI003426398A
MTDTGPRCGAPPAAHRTALLVAVPAHDEAERLPGALRALRAAARHPALLRAGVRVLTVVAADACTDTTAQVALSYGAGVVEVAHRNVGAARGAAVRHGLLRLGIAARTVWIATTDADSLVPPDWLAHQWQRAAEGWECVLGTVRLEACPQLPPEVVERHRSLYYADRAPGAASWSHPHVHGANFGVCAQAYARAGGFPALEHSEDRALVRALERDGARVLRTDRCPVLTSGRTDPRAPHGFGAFLQDLATPVRPGD